VGLRIRSLACAARGSTGSLATTRSFGMIERMALRDEAAASGSGAGHVSGLQGASPLPPHALRGPHLRGLYRWNAFDTSMLIPYFLVMVILAFYGIHRYQLVWLYYRNKKNAAKWDEPGGRYPGGRAAVS
jgi:hypothetical protein